LQSKKARLQSSHAILRESKACLDLSSPWIIDWPNIYSGTTGSGHSYPFQFPWGNNVLEEAWIELHFPEQTYWLEIPYGFTRNPADPPAPPAPQLGIPTLAVATKDLRPKDQIVPWVSVEYDLGEIQNKWSLSLKQANRFDGETELILYREDQQIGKSIHRWEMSSPQTTLKILRADGRSVGSICMSVRRHDDGMRRSDTFRIFRDPGNARDWGRMVITVDEKSYELVMPSSLFRYTHGVAEPHHNRRSWPEK
jgi:hypothetical protein